MLQTFRNHLLGWFAKILIGLISLAFALFGIEYYLVNSRTNQSVATVNGKKITPAQLTMAYNRNRNQLMNQLGSKLKLSQERQELLRQQSLNDLITKEIVYQGAKKAGFVNSPLAFQAMVQQMPAFQVDGQFSYDRMQRVLYNLSYSEKNFYDEVSQAMIVGQLSDGVTQSAFALPGEIDRTYAVTEQKRDFQLMLLPLHQFEQAIKLNDAEIKAYYDAHHNQYLSEAKVSLDYVELNIESLKAKQQASDKEIQDYYQSNLSAFSTPARWQVAKAVVPLSAEPKEKELADAKARINLVADQLKQESTVPTDLKKEWVVASADTKDLVKLFSPMKVGEMTTPEQTSEGWVVYKVLAVETPRPQPLSVVSEKVKDALLKQKSEKDFTARADQLLELAFTHPDSLSEVAKALGVSIQSTEAFSRQGAKEGLASSPKVVSAAFSDEVLQQSSNSNPIDLGNGRIVVVRLKSSEPSRVMPLESVRENIVAVLKRQQAEKTMATLGESIVKSLREGKSINDVIQAHGLRWQGRSNVGYQDKSLAPELIQLAFRISAPKSKTQSYDGGPLLNGDYAVVGVEKVTLADPKNLSKDQREIFKKSIAFNNGVVDFNLYVKDLREKAKVEKGTVKMETSSTDYSADD